MQIFRSNFLHGWPLPSERLFRGMVSFLLVQSGYFFAIHVKNRKQTWFGFLFKMAFSTSISRWCFALSLFFKPIEIRYPSLWRCISLSSAVHSFYPYIKIQLFFITTRCLTWKKEDNIININTWVVVRSKGKFLFFIFIWVKLFSDSLSISLSSILIPFWRLLFAVTYTCNYVL